MWELHTELLSKEFQEFLWLTLKMKDGEDGGMLKVLSIFDILTAFKLYGLLQMTHEEPTIKDYYKRQKMRSDIYQEYREKVWNDFSLRRIKVRKRFFGKKDELTEHLAKYEYMLLIEFLKFALETCSMTENLRRKLDKKISLPYKAISIKKKIKYSQWTVQLVDKITKRWRKK